MKLSNSVFMLSTGVGIGVALVLSCGDDSPRRADAGDAASCSCPAAEPPLASRIVEVVKPFVVPANSMQQAQSVQCGYSRSCNRPLPDACPMKMKNQKSARDLFANNRALF